jgi:zinc protease
MNRATVITTLPLSVLLLTALGCGKQADNGTHVATEASPPATSAEPLSNKNNILPYPIHQHQLDNGLNVVTVPFDSPGTAAFYTVFRVGSRDEVEDGVTGFAHFFEHMMFRGTDKYPPDEYQAVLKATGASANANTSSDRTVYHMTGNKDKLDLMFEIEADRFMHLNYSEHGFKTEAGAVKGEYTKNYASPYQQIYEKIHATAFDKHTYKHTTMGFFDDIVDMPNQFEYSKQFFDRFYRPEYATIIVVGDVSPQTVNSLAEKYFSEWKRGTYVSKVETEPKQQGTRYVHLQDGSIPPYFSLNYKGPAFDDSEIDMPALDILSQVLFSSTSPLYKKLVLEEQKVRDISGGAGDSRDPNLFTIDVSMVDNADMQYVKDEIIKAIEQVKLEGVDPNRLADIQSNLKYSFAMSIDNPDSIARSLAHYVSLTGDPESINRLYAQYDEVTVDEVIKVAKQYFVESALTIATISEDAEGGLK